jgi:hypothetical protein
VLHLRVVIKDHREKVEAHYHSFRILPYAQRGDERTARERRGGEGGRARLQGP